MELKELLARWFEAGDQAALEAAFTFLWHLARPPGGLRRALGDVDADDLRQEVLTRLLDRRSGGLRDADAPAAYTLAAFRNEARSRLRVARRREALAAGRKLEMMPGAAGICHAEPELGLARQVDAARTVVAQLDGERRRAVLLTVAPTRLSDSDWQVIAARHPPPPPPRPTHPLDRTAASLLLYGPVPGETDAAREERFRKLLERACRQVLDAIAEDT
ncbi:hypothetical protein [Sorangium sp. So ce128]|uniref:hypothetical protein n=1 Tax=Sorangium sp. So ce128 TaxID=3133281 RepID=UPI003F62B69D